MTDKHSVRQSRPAGNPAQPVNRTNDMTQLAGVLPWSDKKFLGMLFCVTSDQSNISLQHYLNGKIYSGAVEEH